MTEREILDFIRENCANEVNTMIDVITYTQSVIAGRLIAEYGADTDTLNKAETIFNDIVKQQL